MTELESVGRSGLASPILICGMHRSGTSMVAQALAGAGVQLGRDDELLSPAADNPRGFFERVDVVSINEALLGDLGGAWDTPPKLHDQWWTDDRLGHLRAEAAAVIARFDGAPAWAIKDPRMSILMDFWLSLLEDPPTLVCVRNPLEVALSLHRRNGISYALGLQLWSQYHRAIDAATAGRDRVVSHYAAWLPDDSLEFDRVTTALGIDVVAAETNVAPVVDRQLRHGRMNWTDLEDAGVSESILEQYRALCEASGWNEPDAPWYRISRPAAASTVNRASPGDPESLDGVSVVDDQIDVGRIDSAAIDHADLLHQFHVRGGYIAILERRLSEADAMVTFRDHELSRLRVEVESLRARPEVDPVALVHLLESLALDVAATRPIDEDPEAVVRRATADRWRRVLHPVLPADSASIVVGHPDILGVIPGRSLVPHVRADNAVGVELDRLAGARYAVIAGGWAAIDERPGLTEALRHFHAVVDGEDLVVLLLDRRITSVPRRVADALDAAELRLGHGASVLDLTSWVSQVPMLADRRTFQPMPPGSEQHLLDGAVDVVLTDPLATLAMDVSGEATDVDHLDRLALDTILAVTPGHFEERAAEHRSGRIPSVSVVVTTELPSAALDVMRDSLPAWSDAELIMPGALSGADESYGIRRRWIDVAGVEGATRTNQLMAAADGEILVVVDVPLVPERGWLAPLVDALTNASVVDIAASVVVPSVFQPNGTLVGFGYRDDELVGAGLDRSSMDVVAHRQVLDAVSGPVVAMTRAAFASSGGLDSTLATGSNAWSSLTENLRDRGHVAMAVPESVMVLELPVSLAANATDVARSFSIGVPTR